MGREPLPRESGWTGYVTVGVGGTTLQSNSLAGSTWREIGEPRLGSLSESPGRAREAMAVATGEIGYFFQSTGTHIFAGNVLEDLVRYDFSSRLGVSQSLGGAGVLGVDLLGTTTPALVWSDPFAVGRRRESTERASTGARLAWDRIGGSGLEVELTARSIGVDDEASGEALGLSPSDRALLSREGRQRQVRLSWHIPLSRAHSLLPRLGWSEQDLDGGAEAHARASAELSWTWRSPLAVVASTAYLGRAEYDRGHPIYSRTRKDSILGATVTGFFPAVIPGNHWSLTASAGVYESRSNIDFFHTRVGLAALAVMFRL
jgi:hypothetical protein